MVPDFDFQQYSQLIEWFFKGVKFLATNYSQWREKGQQAFKNRILDYLNTRTEPADVGIIHSKVVIRPIIEDVRFGIAFPPKLKGWQRIKTELKCFPYEARHRWRMYRRYIPPSMVNQHLLDLLRDGRVRYNPNTQRYSSVNF